MARTTTKQAAPPFLGCGVETGIIPGIAIGPDGSWIGAKAGIGAGGGAGTGAGACSANLNWCPQ
jgi:hypothetical protein